MTKRQEEAQQALVEAARAALRKLHDLRKAHWPDDSFPHAVAALREAHRLEGADVGPLLDLLSRARLG